MENILFYHPSSSSFLEIERETEILGTIGLNTESSASTSTPTPDSLLDLDFYSSMSIATISSVLWSTAFSVMLFFASKLYRLTYIFVIL